jgi:hypothetical protein
MTLSRLTTSLLAALALAMVAPIDATAQPKAPPAGSAKPEAPTAASIAAKVQAFYNQTNTFQASFKQVYKVKAYNQTKKSTATRPTFVRSSSCCSSSSTCQDVLGKGPSRLGRRPVRRWSSARSTASREVTGPLNARSATSRAAASKTAA